MGAPWPVTWPGSSPVGEGQGLSEVAGSSRFAVNRVVVACRCLLTVSVAFRLMQVLALIILCGNRRVSICHLLCVGAS